MPLSLINISLLVNEPADSVLEVVLPESFIDRAIFDENTSTFLLASCVPLTEVVCSRFDFLDALGLEALLAAPVQHLVLLVHEWSTFSVDIFDIVGAIVDELVHHFLKVRDTYCFEQSFRWSCSVEADAVLIVVVVALLS